MKYKNMQEGEVINHLREDFFQGFDTTRLPGKIDFTVSENEFNYLWAEAKAGKDVPLLMLTQLVLTMGKLNLHTRTSPPLFIGCFDAEKMTLLQYRHIEDIFSVMDINWNTAPSNRKTEEFEQVKSLMASYMKEAVDYDFEKDEKWLKRLIKDNFIPDHKDLVRDRVTLNTMYYVYNRWAETVKPQIDLTAEKWEKAEKDYRIFDVDFFLSDLISDNNWTVREDLSVVLQGSQYVFNKQKGQDIFASLAASVGFKDKGKTHAEFWRKYQRPPKEEEIDKILANRYRLSSTDWREFSGAFYTPPIWVDKSQRAIEEVLGENWQEEYFIWDCAAGSGNLLAGLTNGYNIWASTLEQADADVMITLSNSKKLNLPESHIFQFDFLNDDFTKLPEGLKKILDDEEKRKKLVIYINPPIAEAGNKKTVSGKGKNKTGVSDTRTKKKYQKDIGKSVNDLTHQFLFRIYREIPGCILAQFSKPKHLQGPSCEQFRNHFQPKLLKAFLTPSRTYENVKGDFPIGFFIWDTKEKELFTRFETDVYDRDGNLTGTKTLVSPDGRELINRWLKEHEDKQNEAIGMMSTGRNDFSHQDYVYIQHSIKDTGHSITLTSSNLTTCCVYFAVRWAVKRDWINDKDQFFAPNKSWEDDGEFKSDCLAFTLFHNQNKISCPDGINHWIPFTENDIKPKDNFDSRFMVNFIKDFVFSSETKEVFDAGKAMYFHYHKEHGDMKDASLHDIRNAMQGRKPGGARDAHGGTPEYRLIDRTLKAAVQKLAKKIEPKIYEYGFLLKD